MNNTVMNLSVLQLSIAYIFVLIMLIIFKSRGIKREKQMLIATTRMTLQLTILCLPIYDSLKKFELEKIVEIINCNL